MTLTPEQAILAAIEEIFRSRQFQDRLQEVLTEQLGAAIAPTVAPSLSAAIKRELPNEFLRGLKALTRGEYTAKTLNDEERLRRDARVLEAVAEGVPQKDISMRFNISTRHIQRLQKKHKRHLSTDVA